MKELDSETLIKTLFLSNLFINLRSERTLNVYLRSYKFIFSFFLSLINLIA